MRNQKILIIFGIFLFILFVVTPSVLLFSISSSQPQAPFFIGQRYIDLRIYPDAKIVCQRFPEGWYCNGFDYIDRSLLQAVDFNMTYTDETPAVLDMLGLNKKVNRVVGRRYLNEKEEKKEKKEGKAMVSGGEETDRSSD